MPIGMHHTGIVVRDIEAMVDFYTRVLGMTILNDLQSLAPPTGNHTGIPNSRRRLVFVGWPGEHQIELVHYIEPPASDGHLDKHQLGAMHVCFNVANIEESYRRLSDQGVRFVTEPKYQQVEDGQVGIVYAQDPEGNWLEFIQWPEQKRPE